MSQIHYGGNKVTDEVPSTEQVTTIANELHLVSNDNKSNDDNDSDVTTVEAITNESPEVIFPFLIASTQPNDNNSNYLILFSQDHHRCEHHA